MSSKLAQAFLLPGILKRLSIPVSLKQYPKAKAYAIRAMAESGASYKEMREATGAANETILAIKRADSFDPERVKRLKEGLAAKFYDKIDQSLDAITPEKLVTATAQQNMMVAAIGLDKARLIDGDPTARVEFVNSSDRELAGQIAELTANLQRLERGEILDAELSTNQAESLATLSDNQETTLPEGEAPQVPSINQSVSQVTSK